MYKNSVLDLIIQGQLKGAIGDKKKDLGLSEQRPNTFLVQIFHIQ
jgi:hypothetical protein